MCMLTLLMPLLVHRELLLERKGNNLNTYSSLIINLIIYSPKALLQRAGTLRMLQFRHGFMQTLCSQVHVIVSVGFTLQANQSAMYLNQTEISLGAG